MQDLQTAHEEYMASKTEQAGRLQRAEEKVKDLEVRISAADLKSSKAEASLVEKEKEKQSVQGELDDLLMVFGDLEDKVKQYRERLQKLGENVSDGEEEEEEDGDGEEEDDVD